MDLTQLFDSVDELADYCLLEDNAIQDAALAERLKMVAARGTLFEGMQCSINRNQQ